MSTVERLTVRQRLEDRALLVYPDSSTGAGLDGIRIGLRLRHSAIEDRCYMWLVDSAGVAFAGPTKLVRGLDLFLPWKYDERVPQGQLFLRGDEATKATLDVTAQLCYRPPALATAPTPA